MPTGKTFMTPSDASRIQSATARASGGGVPSGSFASRAQSAASSNVNSGRVGGGGGGKGGGGGSSGKK